MIGIIFILLVGLTEKLSFYNLLKSDKQELRIISNYLIISFIFMIVSFFSYNKFDFSFLNDKLFYLTLFLENLILWLSVSNYNKQNNFSQIAFASFSSIYLIIVISYLYTYIFDLESKFSTPYDNFSEMILYSLLFFILTLFYFFDKIKTKDIKRPILLFFYAIFLVNTMFFAIYTLQNYQSFLVYIIIFLSLALQYYFHYINRNKSLKIPLNDLLDKKELKLQISFSFFYLLAWVFTIIGTKFLAVEFITIFKRIGQIVSSQFIDKFLFKKNKKVSIKDTLIIFIIVGLTFFIYFK